MDPMLLVAVGVLVLVLAVFVKLLSSSSKEGEVQDEPAEEAPRAPRPQRDVAMAGGRRVRAPRNRMHRAVRAEDSDEENDDGLPDDIELPEGKVGAKKLRKLQEKEEKRRQREAELQEREEKKRREALLEEKRKKDEARETALEKAREEEERLKKEEEEKREHEEYLKMKEMFSVDEEGTHEAELNQDTESLLQEFIDYIKQMKVVILEDLASHFKLKTQEAINRVRDLQEEGRLTGVIDDRGKFIYITQEEYESVAKFINQRGRVSMTELAESSNILINLNPDNTETLQKKLLGEQSNEITASA